MLSSEVSYILGLWCADGYHRTSSVGLSNINVKLIKRFMRYLLSLFDEDRLRLRVYVPRSYREGFSLNGWKIKKVSVLSVTKAKNPSYHIYVNSRPFLRELREKRSQLVNLDNRNIIPYFAGRFDGDGSVDKDGRRDFRVVYGNLREAELDKELLQKARPSYILKVYRYKKARTYCLYVSRFNSEDLIQSLKPYSTILNDRFRTP